MRRTQVNKLNKIAAILSIICFILPLNILSQQVDIANDPALEIPVLTEIETNKIEKLVHTLMDYSKIPGMAIVVVKGETTVYNKGFGYSDLEALKPVSPKTLFELGSTSKAFTALGVLVLENKGKIDLYDPVEKYIPWFKTTYKGKDVKINISQLLYQTSGIPFTTIGRIPKISEDDDNALEKTVRTLEGIELLYEPGKKFTYATINYDVLGLIIQYVSGKSYVQFIKDEVLEPLELTTTYLFRKEADKYEMATGYKINLNKPSRYKAPRYSGNIPAGYVITNANDLSHWLKVHLGTADTEKYGIALIKRSQAHNTDLIGSPYAMGWFAYPGTRQISHGGSNPNFSSFIVASPYDSIAVGVLANMNSQIPGIVANGIFSIVKGTEPRKITAKDSNLSFDKIAYKIIIYILPFLIPGIILLLFSIIRIIRRKKVFYFKLKRWKLLGFIIFTIIFIALGIGLFMIPALLSYDLPWSFVVVWSPASFLNAILLLFVTGSVYYLFSLSLILTKRVETK
jgi:putative ATP-binding cassette transporter